MAGHCQVDLQHSHDGHTEALTDRPSGSPAVHVDNARLIACELAFVDSVQGTLAALVRLDVFDALARAGDGAQLTAQELAKTAIPDKSINVSYLERMLRLMSAHKVLHETVSSRSDGVLERRYGLEPTGKYFVKNNKNGSMAYMVLLHQSPISSQTWSHLHESVLDDTANPLRRAGGRTVFEDNDKAGSITAKLFNQAMANHSALYMSAILDVYCGFNNVKVLVDVGGGYGISLSLITARYPDMKGINFDLPHVIADCPEIPGVTHVHGDMFESVPSSGDAILMKWIMHNWDDKSNLKLLKNCYKALPTGGKLVVIDSIAPKSINLEGDNAHRMVFEMGMTMLAFHVSGARERTEREIRELGKAAGFAEVVVICIVDFLAVIEMHKG